MKKLLLTFSLLTFAKLMSAQAPLGEGNWQINGGLGFSGDGVPVYLGFDYGVHQDITLGGQLSIAPHERTYHHDNYTYSQSVFGITALGNYHFNTLLKMPSQWNLYAGLNLGLYFYNYSDKYYNNGHDTSLGLGLQVGGRYFWNKNWGINLEFGGGTVTSGGKVGVTYKL
jgi:hypothetical protein